MNMAEEIANHIQCAVKQRHSKRLLKGRQTQNSMNTWSRMDTSYGVSSAGLKEGTKTF